MARASRSMRRWLPSVSCTVASRSNWVAAKLSSTLARGSAMCGGTIPAWWRSFWAAFMISSAGWAMLSGLLRLLRPDSGRAVVVAHGVTGVAPRAARHDARRRVVLAVAVVALRVGAVGAARGVRLGFALLRLIVEHGVPDPARLIRVRPLVPLLLRALDFDQRLAGRARLRLGLLRLVGHAGELVGHHAQRRADAGVAVPLVGGVAPDVERGGLEGA